MTENMTGQTDSTDCDSKYHSPDYTRAIQIGVRLLLAFYSLNINKQLTLFQGWNVQN